MKNILLIWLLIPIFLFAQQTPMTTFPDVKYLDEVTMKNGYVYQGKIIEMGEKVIVIDILGGFRLHLDHNNIRNIRQKCLNCSDFQGENTYNYRFKETGFYHHLRVGFVSGAILEEIGVNATYSFGKMRSRVLGYGGGLGLFSYIDSRGFKLDFLPVFTEVRSYLFSKKNTPFVMAKAGYGFAMKRTLNSWEQSINKQKGGLFFNPAFGIRFGANENVNLTMDLSFLVQYSKDEYNLNEMGLGTAWRQRTFRRWSFDIGVVF
jgi:hypothetical protein